MIQILIQNFSTIAVGLLLLLACVLVIRREVRNRKSGQNSCGSCGGCAMAPRCHPAAEPETERWYEKV